MREKHGELERKQGFWGPAETREMDGSSLNKKQEETDKVESWKVLGLWNLGVLLWPLFLLSFLWAASCFFLGFHSPATVNSPSHQPPDPIAKMCLSRRNMYVAFRCNERLCATYRAEKTKS
jgi:hypothetical protein